MLQAEKTDMTVHIQSPAHAHAHHKYTILRENNHSIFCNSAPMFFSAIPLCPLLMCS